MLIQNLIGYSLAVILAVAALIVFWAGIRRKRGLIYGKILPVLLAVIAITLAVWSTFNFLGRATAASEKLYISSRLIETGDYVPAQNYAGQVLNLQKDNVTAEQLILLSLCYDNNYDIASAKAQSLLKTSSDDTIRDIYNLSSQKDHTDQSQLSGLLSRIKSNIKISQSSIPKLEAIVSMTSLSSAGKNADLTAAKKTLASSGDSMSLMTLAADSSKAGNNQDTFTLVKDAVQKDDSEQNRIIASNMVMSGFDFNGTASAGQDSEIQSLRAKIDALNTEAASIQKEIQAAQKPTDKLNYQSQLDNTQSKISELTQETQNIPAMRAINYIKASTPFWETGSISTDLQLSKLYYSIGDELTAQDCLTNAFETASRDDTMEWLWPECQTLIRDYDVSVKTQDSTALNASVDSLLSSAALGILVNQGKNDDAFKTFITDSLRAVRAGLHISEIITNNYTEITANINIASGNNADQSALSYTKDDFEVYDSGDPVSDFELTRSDNNDLAVCLVVDRSGSMDGAGLTNAKSAVSGFVQNVVPGVKLGLVSFESSANIDCPVTSSTATVEKAVENLAANGGTNISGGLLTAVTALDSQETNNKVIILLSDGQDGDKTSITPTIAELTKRNIPVYTVGFGDADPTYLGSIADETGGKFLKASTAEDLANIYPIIQKYIFNNYSIKYTVVSNPDVYDRSVKIVMKNTGVFDEKQYHVGVTDEQISLEDNEAPLSDFYKQIGGSYRGGVGQ